MPINIELQDHEVPIVQEALGEYFAGKIASAASNQKQEAIDKARAADELRNRIETIAYIQEAAPPPPPKQVATSSSTPTPATVPNAEPALSSVGADLNVNSTLSTTVPIKAKSKKKTDVVASGTETV